MTHSSQSLLDQVLHADDPVTRRDAFISLLDSEQWRSALVPAVIASQRVTFNNRTYPDQSAFGRAADIIVADEEKLQRSLELAGAPFSDVLLFALARRMRERLIDPALSHLRTAEGGRRVLLQRVLEEADPGWVKDAAAAHAIRRHLRVADEARAQLLGMLARAKHLAEFVDVLVDYPPATAEEWSALGRSGVYHEKLYHLAMAELARTPAVVLYLARLSPLPPAVLPRVLAAADMEWTVAGLELSVIYGLDSRALVPLAELAIRLGGTAQVLGITWVTSSKLARPLLGLLAEMMTDGGRLRLLDDVLHHHSRMPSHDRVLAQVRRNEVPHPLDVAHFVRQLGGRRARDTVREILSRSEPELFEALLRPLCAVREDAAQQVLELCDDGDPEIAARARQARAWPDVAWPDEDSPTPPPPG